MLTDYEITSFSSLQSTATFPIKSTIKHDDKQNCTHRLNSINQHTRPQTSAMNTSNPATKQILLDPPLKHALFIKRITSLSMTCFRIPLQNHFPMVNIVFAFNRHNHTTSK